MINKLVPLFVAFSLTMSAALATESKRTAFDFPTDHTLGLIYILDPHFNINDWPPAYKSTGQVQARGRVNLPAPCRIGWRATGALTIKPEYLALLAKSPASAWKFWT